MINSFLMASLGMYLSMMFVTKSISKSGIHIILLIFLICAVSFDMVMNMRRK